MSTQRRGEAGKNAACAFFSIIGFAALFAVGSSVVAARGQAPRFPMHQFWLVLGIGLAASILISAYIYLVERN